MRSVRSLSFSAVLSMAMLAMLYAPPTFAENAEKREELEKQVAAIGSYIDRTFNLTNTTPLTNTELRALIDAGATWFTHAQEENGHFRYEYVPYSDAYLEDDHIVRQGGALFQLGGLARRDQNGVLEIDETIERAIAFFERISPEDDFSETPFRCIAHNQVSTTCLLGATSLAVIGILGYVEHSPEKQNEYGELIESYMTYILASKKPDAGFRNVHQVGRKNQNEAESSFSNGEALLALVRYYMYNPREEVKEVIDETFTYLKDEPYDTGLYLWIMAALKDMHALWGNEVYRTYGNEFTNWRISRASRFRGTDRNYCAYSEGVASAYSLLKDHLSPHEATLLRNELDYWNTKNSKLQLTAADVYRIIVEDEVPALKKLPRPEVALGGFLTSDREPTQRIDFTQHCISSYLQTLVDIEGEPLS